FLLLVSLLHSTSATRRLAESDQTREPLLFQYDNGPLLAGKISVNLIWYGKFKPSQRAIISDFIASISPTKRTTPPVPSVATWWKATEKYYTLIKLKAGSFPVLSLGAQILDEHCSLGKSLSGQQIIELASKGSQKYAINVVLTASDVAVEGFCSSRCGTHGSASGAEKMRGNNSKFAYIWVGNSETQCPGRCAWPFHKPIFGPQSHPLVAPNNDVGLDGMVINLASLLAGTTTNPFGNGYFQGPKEAPLEAASACAGIYGKGAYPGYAGNLPVDSTTGGSYNAHGVNGRKYLLPAFFAIWSSLVLLLSLYLQLQPAFATTRKLAALVQEQPLVLKYHNGPLLKGNTTVNLLWYGNFSPKQRSIIVDFLSSLSSPKTQPPPPSVSSWWQTTGSYRGGPCTVVVGDQVLDEAYSLGKSLKTPQIIALAAKAGGHGKNVVNVVFTSADVAVDGFCMSRCGTHGSGQDKLGKFAYAWVGNSVTQCPGQCAWPFHQPIYGPQTPPLVAPNGDVGTDGMIINLATVLAGTVTNPFNNGYFQGSADAPLEAVSACTGIFGKGSYPGYPGEVLVQKTTGASYNALGVDGRKYLLPAMWDPETSTCKTFV
ncbi:hypothetical protein Tsubulata_043046, partial [Turnera subulata]